MLGITLLHYYQTHQGILFWPKTCHFELLNFWIRVWKHSDPSPPFVKTFHKITFFFKGWLPLLNPAYIHLSWIYRNFEYFNCLSNLNIHPHDPCCRGRRGWWTQINEPRVIHRRWCTAGDVRRWCTEGDEMHRRCHNASDAQQVMYSSWCSIGDAPHVMHHRWYLTRDRIQI